MTWFSHYVGADTGYSVINIPNPYTKKPPQGGFLALFSVSSFTRKPLSSGAKVKKKRKIAAFMLALPCLVRNVRAVLKSLRR
ncbi:hypothetical protein J4733_17595 [Klebsiella pneumoniae]|uniref:Uncharacterized protein n=1 Tax=Klebsiella pneumoniae TaxID=573 RepID=A0A939NSN5_KLEPN|nr:hypothetical protein [Klebsiella pneumoniae]